MKWILLVFCLSAMLSASAQGRKRTEDSTPDSVYPVSEESAIQMGLTKLSESAHVSSYRFAMPGQIVEIWSDDKISYHGFVLSYVYHWKHKKHILLKKKEDVDIAKAKQIVTIYDSLAINNIPTEKKVKNWQIGMDGGWDTIEYANRDMYSLKEYWEPEDQYAPEGIVITKLFNYLNDIVGLRAKYEKFENELPIGQYDNGMMIITKTVKFRAKGGSTLFRK